MMGNLRIHYLQHVDFEGLGSIEEWVLMNGHTLSATKYYESFTYPTIDEIDWLIVMGGPMGVYDEDKFEWLAEEKKFIKQAIAAGKTVVGVCLGSQLIAEALGAKVYPNKEKEIGWFDIHFTDNAASNELFFDAPKTTKVFHWHGDTFDLPTNAIHLAFSEGCANQAFVHNKKVLGLQFHIETTEESLEDIFTYAPKESAEGNKYIQSAEEMYAQRNFANSNKTMLFSVLDRLVALG